MYLHASLGLNTSAGLVSQVDVFSWGNAIIVYLSLGFSSGHGYASRTPVTFAVTLGLHLACLYATIFMQDRFVAALDSVECDFTG